MPATATARYRTQTGWPATTTPTRTRATLDLQSIADDGIFEGYASLFHREDLGHDVVLPGAFRETLRKRGTAGVRLLFQHDPATPIGAWELLREDARGLYVRGRLTLGVERAREVLALMRAGAVDGLSIGFKTVRARPDRSRGLRLIEAVDLWEISVVTFPLLPDARITAVAQQTAPLVTRSASSIIGFPAHVAPTHKRGAGSCRRRAAQV